LEGGGDFVTLRVTQQFESPESKLNAFADRKIVTENLGIWCTFELGASSVASD